MQAGGLISSGFGACPATSQGGNSNRNCRGIRELEIPFKEAPRLRSLGSCLGVLWRAGRVVAREVVVAQPAVLKGVTPFVTLLQGVILSRSEQSRYQMRRPNDNGKNHAKYRARSSMLSYGEN
jgi:hypothetical protein